MGTQIVNHVPGASYCVYIEGVASGGAFIDKYCRQQYLIRLLNALRPYQVNLHAYTILRSEAYLLLTPQSRTGLSALLGAVRQSYSEYYQTRFERDSFPLSSNIRASQVNGYQLVIDCQKFIERLDVERGLREHTGLWHWSSFTANGFGTRPFSLSQHKHYRRFLDEHENPYLCYREYVSEPMDSKFQAYLTARIRSGLPIAKRPKLKGKAVVTKTKVWEADPTKQIILS